MHASPRRSTPRAQGGGAVNSLACPSVTWLAGSGLVSALHTAGPGPSQQHTPASQGTSPHTRLPTYHLTHTLLHTENGLLAKRLGTGKSSTGVAACSQCVAAHCAADQPTCRNPHTADAKCRLRPNTALLNTPPSTTSRLPAAGRSPRWNKGVRGVRQAAPWQATCKQRAMRTRAPAQPQASHRAAPSPPPSTRQRTPQAPAGAGG